MVVVVVMVMREDLVIKFLKNRLWPFREMNFHLG